MLEPRAAAVPLTGTRPSLVAVVLGKPPAAPPPLAPLTDPPLPTPPEMAWCDDERGSCRPGASPALLLLFWLLLLWLLMVEDGGCGPLRPRLLSSSEMLCGTHTARTRGRQATPHETWPILVESAYMKWNTVLQLSVPLRRNLSKRGCRGAACHRGPSDALTCARYVKSHVVTDRFARPGSGLEGAAAE